MKQMLVQYTFILVHIKLHYSVHTLKLRINKHLQERHKLQKMTPIKHNTNRFHITRV